MKVTSMAPSAAPTRARVRIHTRCHIRSRCCIDRVILNHHSRRRYNDGAVEQKSADGNGDLRRGKSSG